MYHELPLLAFVHKGPDMLNLTGEKVHADQLARALMHASATLGIAVENAQAIPDLEHCRYHLLLETTHPALQALARAVDDELCKHNPEYAGKRASGRLNALCPVRMQSGWGQRLKAADVARGSRESQYKWPFVRKEWDDVTRAGIVPPHASHELNH
jgi:GH3 auxin-responsive promoter